jgi:hypothetical protein
MTTATITTRQDPATFTITITPRPRRDYRDHDNDRRDHDTITPRHDTAAAVTISTVRPREEGFAATARTQRLHHDGGDTKGRPQRPGDNGN